MAHDTIQLGNYFELPSSLLRFYKYSESILLRPESTEEIKKEETEKFLRMDVVKRAAPRLEVPGLPTFEDHLRESIPKQVESDIKQGLPILRRQILVTSHSLFENFLCHVVRVYLYTFPQILKGTDRHLSFREIVALRENTKIFDHIVELEVKAFSHLSLEKKKAYLHKRLFIIANDDIWIDGGEERWKEIDRVRQEIMHGDAIVEISPEYMIVAVDYLQRAMLGISINAQAGQGVPFQWGMASAFTRKRDPPKLKGSLDPITPPPEPTVPGTRAP